MDDLSKLNTELGTIFTQHLSAMSSHITLEQVSILWQDITMRYNEPQRAYHSLQHIQQLFGQFEQIKHLFHEPHIIALAIYYHDVIYEPTRSDNELKSAEYVVKSLTGYLSAEQCQHIYAVIMMTASHQIDKWSNKAKAREKYSDAAYLLDMDLSILGSSWSEYEHYAHAVRQEYAHVSDDDYRVGRMAVLKELLAHPTLYLTDYYYARLEKQARKNIEHEITLLHAS